MDVICSRTLRAGGAILGALAVIGILDGASVFYANVFTWLAIVAAGAHRMPRAGMLDFDIRAERGVLSAAVFGYPAVAAFLQTSLGDGLGVPSTGRVKMLAFIVSGISVDDPVALSAVVLGWPAAAVGSSLLQVSLEDGLGVPTTGRDEMLTFVVGGIPDYDPVNLSAAALPAFGSVMSNRLYIPWGSSFLEVFYRTGGIIIPLLNLGGYRRFFDAFTPQKGLRPSRFQPQSFIRHGLNQTNQQSVQQNITPGQGGWRRCRLIRV